jgi:D-serine deaminase-like pyridoxal phosphate-dependent protein
MSLPPPAEAGIALEDVDTPALILEMEPFERNLRRMTDSLKESGVALRPHAKSHKCPEIALRQLALGAVGVCCQKVTEAEALVAGGVGDVLIANQVVGERKLRRLVELAQRARLAVCADHPVNVAALAAAATAAGARLDVLVELDVGAGRCGAPPAAAAELAQQVAASPGLRFAGLQAYQGAAQHLRSEAERAAAIDRAVAAVQETTALLAAHGIECERVTGGGTGTYLLEAASGVYTEVQPGSYALMDADYGRNEPAPAATLAFEQSLFVLATVMSRPAPRRAVLDAGLKALATDSGLPLVDALEGVRYVKATDEHGVLEIDPSAAAPMLGDKLRLVPGHCDPTVNLHDWIVCVRGGRVEALWRVAARGAVF